ncbi:hypothetical protein NKH77_04170 [Streptomyces sp. M19]
MSVPAERRIPGAGSGGLSCLTSRGCLPLTLARATADGSLREGTACCSPPRAAVPPGRPPPCAGPF